jgi:hypothetical protein
VSAAGRGERGERTPIPLARWGREQASIAAALVVLLLSIAESARADDIEPAGSFTGAVLVSPEADVGGALGGELWAAIDLFRIGGFFGVGVLPSAVDELNRVMMPLGVSAAFELLDGPVGFSIRARGGLWGGATQAVKLTIGAFVGGGAHLLIALGGGASVSIGMDVWGVIGDGQTVLFAPGAGLTWTPTHSAE